MNAKLAKITFRVSQSLAKDISAQAASRGCSQSAFIADAFQKAGKEIGNGERKHLAAVDLAKGKIRTSRPGVKLDTRVRVEYQTYIIACGSDRDHRVVGEVRDEEIKLYFPGQYDWDTDKSEEESPVPTSARRSRLD